MKKIRKPREFYPAKYKHASCSPSFRTIEEVLPACIYVNCDELNLKETKALINWLKKSVKWLEQQK